MPDYNIPDPKEIAVTAATAAQSADPSSNVVTLSTGVQVKVKPVAVGLIQDVQRRYWKVRPSPPIIMIPNKGRVEENPDDPDYQERLAVWHAESTTSLMDAMLIGGTSIHEIPMELDSFGNVMTDDSGAPVYVVPLPEDDRWLEMREVLGLDIDLRPLGRYLAWLRDVAAPKAKDLENLSKAIGSQTGVEEEAVKEHVKRFRS